MPSQKYILDYLYGLQKLGIKPGLTRIRALLKLLGNPEKSYPSIHIAGTNGKGSTSAMLHSVFTEAGYKTGLYTSPHLIKFNERIRIGKKYISDKDIVKAVLTVKKAAGRLSPRHGTPTFFEFITAMAFVYFRDKKVDIAVLETGMGGRLDATNLATPLASIITNARMDHMEFLGNTIRDIAFEKAGIIKKGVPVITGETNGAALMVIKKAAKEMNSPLYIIDKDFKAVDRGGKADYAGLKNGINGVTLGLAGAHQIRNAACALAALEVAREKGFHADERAIKKGLKNTRWPGRLEVVKKRPLVILDSAHNPDGADSLKEALTGFKFSRLILVLGIMADKDIKGILKRLLPLADEVIFTAPATTRAANAQTLIEHARPYRLNASFISPVKDAIGTALELAKAPDAVCVAGSIFTVGEAKKHLPKLF